MNNQKTTPKFQIQHYAVRPACKNCTWWEHDSTCDFIDTISGDTAYKKGHGAAIAVKCLDDQGLSVNLKTGPEFGCVNFHPN